MSAGYIRGRLVIMHADQCCRFGVEPLEFEAFGKPGPNLLVVLESHSCGLIRVGHPAGSGLQTPLGLSGVPQVFVGQR
jgi:hypothetical protein